ncbi:hypothetical protein Bca4012_044455 [Brassica carinata]
MQVFQIWKTSGTTYLLVVWKLSGSRLEVVWTSWKSSDKVVWTSCKVVWTSCKVVWTSSSKKGRTSCICGVTGCGVTGGRPAGEFKMHGSNLTRVITFVGCTRMTYNALYFVMLSKIVSLDSWDFNET